jgi:hypothetical protein
VKRLLLFSLALLVAFGVSVPRASADVSVYVGYADNLRPSPFFPIGFGLGMSLGSISPGGTTQVFTGGGTFDAGAILIVNTGASSITLDSLSATIPTSTVGTVSTSTLWAGFGSSILAPGNGAIFTQTGSFNFDTSDFGAFGLNSTSNCDPGNPFATANAAFCASIAPTVTISVNGTLLAPFVDSGQVLDTGGFDLVSASPCPGGNNANNTPGNCNESLQWRLIGTTGISNPGGNTPEPASLLLLGTGILSLCGAVRKRLQA